MTGDASWVTLAALIVGGVFILALVAAGRAKGLRRARLSVECPATSRVANLVTLQDETNGRHTDVVSCSELRGDVTCAKTCLAQANPPR